MKLIYRDRSKHFLLKKQRSFATVISTSYVSLYDIDPDALTLMYTIKSKGKILTIPASQVVRIL